MRQQIVRADYETVTTMDRLQVYIDHARRLGYLSFDTETTSVDAQSCELVGISLSTDPGIGAYVPLGHATDTAQLDLVEVLEALRPILESPVIIKILHNAKYDVSVMARYGVEITNIDDSMLMSLSLFGGLHRHNMDELAYRYHRYTTIKYKEVAGSGATEVTFDRVPVPAATAYAAEDSDVTLRLFNEFRSQLLKDPDSARVYEQLEKPLIPVIAGMEQAGIKLDVDYLRTLTEEFTASREQALERAYSLAGQEFNPGSPRQVGAVLKALGAPLTELTETGQLATGVKVLEDIEHSGQLSETASELVKAILEWRKFSKLIGTYTEALPEFVNAQTGRIHPSFGMASTTTGRLACSDPNIQNIPIRTPEGARIRYALVAEPGHKLIAADYSQVELRVLAHATGDPALFHAFENGIDIHRMTAAQINGIRPEDVDKGQRRAAKTVNFGIIYGQTEYGLARELKISTDEAAAMIRKYFATFPTIKTYMERARAMARELGYVQTIAGRKIWAPEINSRNKARRGYAERQVINAPIQGTAADIIKKAMLNVSAGLAHGGWKTRLLMQVHDELVFEAPDSEVELVLPLIKATMETCVDYLDVALVVDAKAGQSWGDCK
jgi:DNA polymerase-1